LNKGKGWSRGVHPVCAWSKIVKGAKPADLPTLQSTRFVRALGIEVPSGLLAIADEVIE
jgi:hypothetical protein